MQIWQGYIMVSHISINVYGQYIFFHKFDNLAAILNILAYFSQTRAGNARLPEY